MCSSDLVAIEADRPVEVRDAQMHVTDVDAGIDPAAPSSRLASRHRTPQRRGVPESEPMITVVSVPTLAPVVPVAPMVPVMPVRGVGDFLGASILGAGAHYVAPARQSR